ncbi:zinc carboxypeptidase [Lacibacter cauensis]|uniref:Zinc carboxypeptidase n=2 Tax=Lacibacter cauensis TaxID=510947 RepID=A0A562SYF9_9BACT|nr:zinc carboxypeptidase [Lacibacter cauensis]
MLTFATYFYVMRKILSLILLLALVGQASAQLQSPEQFLGYKIGTRYTPHWKIVSYFQHVAANAPKTVKLQQYGQTNEGRPLMVAFISSEENMNNLEAIRANNLRLANLSRDKAAPNENAAPIVWLSYNVHGNETSSSEAALMTVWALVDPANTKIKEWLKNTVVVMDPCINPDGRDRYVNWFNSVVGVKATPRMDTREHRDPWPGGRSNHYNFDLNRDWAWQTQVESQQRLKLYNQWMPQIHVDYHEQGINEPYYFAPAAEPYHEIITQWQRDFQTTIGKSHAKYFDANGWLYFTKLRFDLFYPSYGDTYPTYNGAIGMTYEQGGGPAGGATALTEEGDTLTLYDRAIHHFTTGMSTIEIASINASKLITEYRKFFNRAVSGGFGEYKTYIIKNNPKDADRLQALLQLLEKNGIEYGTATGNGKGYNYFTAKEESFSVANGDVVVSAFQPRSAMVQALLEPKSKLSDSATYDITAWSLPYAYGLQAFATKDRINPTAYQKPAAVVNTTGDVYAYVIKWEGLQSAKTTGQLLQKGITLRYSEVPFEVNGQKFDRGSVIVMKTSNQAFGADLWKHVVDAANANNVKLYPVTTGFVDNGGDFGSDLVTPFKMKRVVLLTGEGVSSLGAGEIWHFFDKQLEYPVSLVYANDFSRIDWAKTDVIIMPDGNYRFMSDKSSTDELKEWVSKGGKVIALESAVAAFARLDWGLKSKKAEGDNSKDPYQALASYENRERDFVSTMTPGSIYKVQLDNTHPLAFGYPEYYYTLKMDDNIYEFMNGNGWNVGVLKKENQLAGFVGSKLQNRLKDGLLFGAQNIGRGSVIYLTDDIMFRNFWENGKLMLCNAVFF